MNVKKWFSQKGIREQIFSSMLLLSILAMAVLGYVSYRSSANAIEENYKESYDSTLKNSSKVLDMNLRGIIEAVRGYISDDNICELLMNSDYEGYQFAAADQARFSKATETLVTQNVSVNGIAFMDLNGHYYMYNNTEVGTYYFYTYYKTHDILDEEWTEAARNAKGKEVFFAENVLAGGDKDALCMAKYLINPSSSEPMGYLVVPLSQKILRKSIVVSGMLYQNNSFMVVDETHDYALVYFDGDDAAKEEMLAEYKLGAESTKYVFTSVKNTTTGWNIVSVIEKNELSKDIKEIGVTVVLCGIGIIFLSFILARMISQTISNPLKKLENVIAQVGNGDRHITEEFDDGEVGRIGSKFKEMVNTNLELSERLMSTKLNEREAELLLLQSQINPHYLYNTLDSLYFMAIMHEDDELAEMIMALSNNFRLALNNGEKYIRVSDSIKWIEEYMKLQNMRYNHRFELFIDVEEEIKSKKTLMFILQPFIENAMYHGLEAKIGKGKISVKGWREGENMVFTIEDDGVGVQDISVLEKGYGIRNVKERIRLNYGEAYGVDVESTYGEGTKVTIVVPLE